MGTLGGKNSSNPIESEPLGVHVTPDDRATEESPTPILAAHRKSALSLATSFNGLYPFILPLLFFYAIMITGLAWHILPAYFEARPDAVNDSGPPAPSNGNQNGVP
ncbi:hypothetical protein BPNPMPFG_003349 [Mesorhizobium sp. AR07]|uniref:hypothetical protein n=1 Tax=Mesorhizobium sp. AR07 TaxID=2865838 RepID=UPI0021609C36|nr:hypothetical protein [Mesorhizobium sp. AR07]UVK47562.1 hypothetical protein BPNPMPFG_003349 [Mesorhizobium sp. AR07]